MLYWLSNLNHDNYSKKFSDIFVIFQLMRPERKSLYIYVSQKICYIYNFPRSYGPVRKHKA